MPTVFLISLALFFPFFSDSQPLSPVDLRIEAARKQVQADPKSAGAWNTLAFALIRKARDVQDEATYREAGKALDRSLQLTPGDYDAQKLRVSVLLGLNQPSEALKLETELNRKVPDDIAGWALLVDAYAELGDYDKAELAAQWVLDLRPGSSLGFEKAAALRELFGDSEGALEFLDEANRRTSPSDADQKAWLLTQKARLILASGDMKGAANLLAEASRLFPNSQLAEYGLAQVRVAEGNYAEAATMLEQRYRLVPSAQHLYDWAGALAMAGKTQEADLQFAAFEKRALADKSAALQLIDYYSNQKSDPAKALSIATTEAAERHDSATLAAYAWALYRNGRYSEAKVEMEKALAVGVRNPLYFCHAVSISTMAKDDVSVSRYTKELRGMPGKTCSTEAPLESASKVSP